VGELLPALSAWAETLLVGGFCHRLSLDTYERELERYGGEAGIDIAEEIFCADSEATTELLALLTRGMLASDRTGLAVLSLDDLLGSLGLAEGERLEWCRKYVKSRPAGPLYREHNDTLRSVLGEPSQEIQVRRVLAKRRAAIERFHEEYVPWPNAPNLVNRRKFCSEVTCICTATDCLEPLSLPSGM
jgi:class I lanthipeptide synthase